MKEIYTNIKMFDRKDFWSVFISRFSILAGTCWGRIKVVLNDQGRPVGEDPEGGSFFLGWGGFGNFISVPFALLRSEVSPEFSLSLDT